ncbi:MAG TPA: GNAT family N-acetyltransferase [Thermomicrobiales bacterium]|jgi:RimJ/RimL family protein N-acetyltransferase|nr:GNAT family N-acetyltransferase [Thermomicrobiales bacterium]
MDGAGPVRSKAIYRTLIDVPTRLDGQRVTLRSLGPADAPELLAAIAESRAEFAPWIRGVSRIMDIDDATDYCARMAADWIERSRLCFAVRARHDGRLLGEVTLHRIDWNIGSAEVGFWLRTTATGGGYMTEAMGLVTHLIFDLLGGQRIVLRADSGNRGSIAIAERLGFCHEATHRRAARGSDDTLRDVVVYAKVRENHPE